MLAIGRERDEVQDAARSEGFLFLDSALRHFDQMFC
jgi:hypothetical protein